MTETALAELLSRDLSGLDLVALITDAYHAEAALQAEAAMLALAKEIDRTHAGAAASNSAASTATCTYRHSAQLSNVKSPHLSEPHAQ